MRNIFLTTSICVLFCFCGFVAKPQTGNVGIGTNTPNSSAVLDINSTDKGLLIPRMNTSQRLGISPVNGLIVYDTDSSDLFIYAATLWKRLKAFSTLANILPGNNAGDILMWNGSAWAVTPKCDLFSYYYRDKDGDGHGDKYTLVMGCSAPPGYVTDSTDCNDNRSEEHTS